MITVISNVPPAIHFRMFIKLITLNALKSFRVETMPNVAKIKKFIEIFAKAVFYHTLGLIIINKRTLIVEFGVDGFEIYRTVVIFADALEEGVISAPVRNEDHPDYHIDYASCLIFEKLHYSYPPKDIDLYIIRKILENL